MKCPNCNIALVMADRNGIEIDYCPDCRGIWLDRGELDKIIDRSVQRPSSHGSNYGAQERYHSERAYYQKKKKSFLGELFDF